MLFKGNPNGGKGLGNISQGCLPKESSPASIYSTQCSDSHGKCGSHAVYP